MICGVIKIFMKNSNLIAYFVNASVEICDVKYYLIKSYFYDVTSAICKLNTPL
jgi:hypothetical protein